MAAAPAGGQPTGVINMPAGGPPEQVQPLDPEASDATEQTMSTAANSFVPKVTTEEDQEEGKSAAAKKPKKKPNSKLKDKTITKKRGDSAGLLTKVTDKGKLCPPVVPKGCNLDQHATRQFTSDGYPKELIDLLNDASQECELGWGDGTQNSPRDVTVLREHANQCMERGNYTHAALHHLQADFSSLSLEVQGVCDDDTANTFLSSITTMFQLVKFA
jgi:hypothetical protein